MRQGRVYCNGTAAGIITEDENGYSFAYDKEYLNTPGAQPVSLTLSLREEPYVNNVMFSFFDGLIPGCRDCIRNVSVAPITAKEER